jgi:hypothetical protein
LIYLTRKIREPAGDVGQAVLYGKTAFYAPGKFHWGDGGAPVALHRNKAGCLAEGRKPDFESMLLKLVGNHYETTGMTQTHAVRSKIGSAQ